jgi:signal peptidase I
VNAVNQFISELDKFEYILLTIFVAAGVFMGVAYALRSAKPHWLRTLAGAVFLAVVLAMGVRIFLFEAYVIPSPSMEPALAVGDKVLAFKGAFGWACPFWNCRFFMFSKPVSGDVVLAVPPGYLWTGYIKRVAACEGEIVEIKGKQLWVNGKARDFGKEHDMAANWRRREKEQGVFLQGQNRDWFGPITIPAGCVFLLGDNRAHSRDSRYFGPVPLNRLRGKLFYRYAPASRRGWLTFL